MNLQSLIEQFIAYRQSLGEQWPSNCHFRAFGRFIGADVEVADVSPEQVNSFLAGAGPITLTWHIKLGSLRSFYQYAVSRGYVAKAPLPTVLPKRPPTFVPYVYSHGGAVPPVASRQTFSTGHRVLSRERCISCCWCCTAQGCV